MCKIIEQHPNNFNVAESQSSLEILKRNKKVYVKQLQATTLDRSL